MSFLNIDSKRVGLVIETEMILLMNKNLEQYHMNSKEKKKLKLKTTTVRLNKHHIRREIGECGLKMRWRSCRLPYNATAQV